MTTAARWPFGRYQKRGSGLRSRSMTVMRLASRRCCSSACGMATLFRSTQLACGSLAEAPKNLSFERTGLRPSRSWLAHAGLPWRVYTTDLARSKANEAAWPPLLPTLFSVMAAAPVDAVALEYRVASELAPLSVMSLAAPWYCMEAPAMPAPTGVDLLTAR